MGIEIQQLNGPLATRVLVEINRHLILPEELKGTFIVECERMLLEQPDSIQFVVATKLGEVVGFCISQLTRDFIYVAQIWSKPGNSSKIADEMFLHPVLWAVSTGRRSIRAETKRDLMSLYHRAGFIERSVTIEKPITPEVLGAVFQNAREVFNGRSVQQAKVDDKEYTQRTSGGAPGSDRPAPSGEAGR